MAGLFAIALLFALLNLIQKGLLASGPIGYNPVHLKNAIRL